MVLSSPIPCDQGLRSKGMYDSNFRSLYIMTIDQIINRWAHPLLLRGVLREEFKRDLLDLIAHNIVNAEEKFLNEFKEIVKEIYH